RRADLGGARARGSPRWRREFLFRFPVPVSADSGARSGVRAASRLLPTACLLQGVSGVLRAASGVLRAASRLLRLLRTAGLPASLLRASVLLRRALPVFALPPWLPQARPLVGHCYRDRSQISSAVARLAVATVAAFHHGPEPERSTQRGRKYDCS